MASGKDLLVITINNRLKWTPELEQLERVIKLWGPLHTLTFDLYSEDRLRGDFLGTVERNFTVVNDLG